MQPAGRELSVLREVTANFTAWQGLRSVPIGAALLVVAWTALPGFPLGAAARGWTWSTAIFLGAALSELAGRYYAMAYGRVRPLGGFYDRPEARLWYVLFPVMGLGLLVDLTLAPAVTLSGPVFGVAIEGFRRSTGGGRRHYLFGSATLLALGPLPLLGVLSPGSAALHAAIAVLGMVFVVGGLLDHLALCHLLPSVRPDGGSPPDGSALDDSSLDGGRASVQANNIPTPEGGDGSAV